MMAKAPRTNIDATIDETDGVNAAIPPAGEDAVEEVSAPSYRVYEDARIPVSKQVGRIWKSRHDTGRAKMKANGSIEAWDEAIRYYKNDQTGKKDRNNPDSPSDTSASRDIAGGLRTNTENVVFSNVSALVPSIYAKNPDVSIHSPKGDDDLAFTTCAQKLIRTLMQKRTAPGINLKPKMRRNVVITTLTNIGWIEVGYTRREVSSDATLAEIDKIAVRLQNAKDKGEIVAIEGELQAMEDKIDLLQPSGPWAVFRNPKDVIVDPDASLIDGTDAKWSMVRDVFETSFINAVYRKKDPDTGKWQSLYKPTHVLKASPDASTNMAGHDEEITNFQLIKDNDDWKQFGFDNEDAYRRAGRTFVWKVWDRITRRVYLFAENDWAWPIWVWDDPYGLDDFFPLSPLAFHTDPEELYARGEASYYLDQQDEINDINSQVSRMRRRVADTLVYDKNKIKDIEDVRKLIRPTHNGDNVVGVNVPEGMKIADMLSAPPVPAVEYAQLFDKKSLFDAIDRVSGVPSVVKGVEFRTNTTNKAIDSYESTSAQRLDEKIDAIEECIGRIGYMILVMCLQFMSKAEVIALIGEKEGAAWPGPMSAKEAQTRFTLTVTGGSSLKPTSKVRKEQAKEAAQIMGQFGANNPAILLVVLKMFARAYSDEIVMEKSDWDLILQSVQGQIQQSQQPPAGAAPPPGGEAANANAEQPPQVDPKQIIKMVSEMFRKMPDKIRQGVGQEIAQGEPLEKILQKLQHLQGAGGGAPEQAPPQQAAE